VAGIFVKAISFSPFPPFAPKPLMVYPETDLQEHGAGSKLAEEPGVFPAFNNLRREKFILPLSIRHILKNIHLPGSSFFVANVRY